MRRWLAHVLVLTIVMASLAGTSRSAESATPSAARNLDAEAPSAVEPAPTAASARPLPLQQPAEFASSIERWRAQSVQATGIARNVTGISVDADLLLALVAVESGGEPDARSAAGAVGLTQVEPTTFGDLQERYRAVLGQRRLEEPPANLLAGALYLADCTRLLHADLNDPAELNLVLDAYNLGPRAVTQWAATGTWLDGTEVQRTLPDETVEHAARIVAAYHPAYGAQTLEVTPE